MNMTAVNNVCRLCANPSDNYYSIFDQVTDSIVEKIHNCLPIVVGPDDELPSQICDACLEALNISNKLRSQCILADSVLRTRLNSLNLIQIKREEDPLVIKTETLGLNINGCNEDNTIDRVSNFTLNEHEEDHSEIFVEKKFMVVYSDSFDDPLEDIVTENPLKIEEDRTVPDVSVAIEEELSTQCNVCNITINDKELMGLHIKFHQPRSMYCYICNTTLPSPYELYLHKKTDHIVLTKFQMKWFCERCEIFTHNPKFIIKHRKQCTKDLHQCSYCDEVFVHRKQFNVHQKQKHYELMLKDPNRQKFECKYCNKTYLDRDLYTKHLRGHRAIEDKAFKCSYCSKTFPSKGDMRLHVQGSHERDKIFKCDICSKIFYKESNMKIHKRMHNRHTCHKCKKTFDTWKRLDQHLNDDHSAELPERNKYSCKQCGARFLKQPALRDHENLHTGKRPYVCEICKKSFAAYGSLWSHRRVHNRKNFYCDYCKQSYSNKGSLRRHISKHQPSTDWLYDCEICKLKFRNEPALERHLNINEDTHVVVCNVCSLEFLGMRRLKRHRNLVHDIWETNDSSETASKTNDKAKNTRQQSKTTSKSHAYCCKECGEVFSQLESFQDHQKSHTGKQSPSSKSATEILDKPADNGNHHDEEFEKGSKRGKYCCKECGKSFTQLRSFQDHQFNHTGKQPYVCKICNKTYNRYNSWWSHQRIHSQIRFQCDYCKKEFTAKHLLGKHIAQHRPPEEWEHSCNQCKMTFWSRRHQQRHLKACRRKSHHIICQLCDMTFLGAANLKEHMSTVHDAQEEDRSSQKNL